MKITPGVKFPRLAKSITPKLPAILNSARKKNIYIFLYCLMFHFDFKSFDCLNKTELENNILKTKIHFNQASKFQWAKYNYIK